MNANRFVRSGASWVARLAALAGAVAVLGCQSKPAKAQAAPGWTLSFQDEFNGTSLDTSKWNTKLMWDGKGARTLEGNYEAQVYLDTQFEQSGGKLRIRADRKDLFWDGNGYPTPATDPNSADVPNDSYYHYASGLLATYQKFAQQNGYFEMRAKMPAGKGLWPAFWMLANRKVWPPEIDILEFRGADHEWTHHAGIITQGDTFWDSTLKNTGVDYTADFHTFGFEWNDSDMRFYIDGVQIGRGATDPGVKEPMQLIVNLAVGTMFTGASGGAPDGSTVFPAYLDVDYVRAYTRNAGATTPVPGFTGVVVDEKLPWRNNSTPNVSTVTGAWTQEYKPLAFNSDVLHDGNTGKGSKSVRFNPNFPVAGNYEAFLHWSGNNPDPALDGGAASNVPVTITNASGATATRTVNQRINGGQWVSLGTYAFNAGFSGGVTVSNAGTDGYVFADAVKFVPVSGLPPGVPFANGIYRLTPGSAPSSSLDADQEAALGAKVQIWRYFGSSNQKWLLTNIGGNTYTIASVNNTNRVLDADNASSANGTRIIVWDSYGGQQQKWNFVALGNGKYRIQPSYSSAVSMDVPGGDNANADGLAMMLYQNNNGLNQQWTLSAP